MNDTIFFAGYFLGLAVLMAVCAMMIISPPGFSRIISRSYSAYPGEAGFRVREFLRVNRGLGIGLFLGAAVMFLGPLIQSISPDTSSSSVNDPRSGFFGNHSLTTVIFVIQFCFGIYLWTLPMIVAQDLRREFPEPNAVGKGKAAQIILIVRILGAALGVSGFGFLLFFLSGRK